MPVPDFQSLMLPVLETLQYDYDMSVAELRDLVSIREGLTQEDLRELFPSGKQTVFANRIHWALYALTRAKLAIRTYRATYRLTDSGVDLLKKKPQRVDRKLLLKYPAYREHQKALRLRTVTQKKSTPVSPDEEIGNAIQQLQNTLETDVLDRVREASPSFLEQVVIDLLTKMGYGGGDPARGFVTGGPGDGGIDGTIREDVLGLDEVYVQTKRYAEGHTVGPGDLRNFVGAIDTAGTTKGVFVTTANFSNSAKEVVKQTQKRIVLIDGEELARLMIQHDVGVRIQTVYKTKRIDEDYFEQ